MKDITNIGHGRFPMCLKCNRSVDSFEIETPVTAIDMGNGIHQLEHTGEIIVTVKCHGETYQQSIYLSRI